MPGVEKYYVRYRGEVTGPYTREQLLSDKRIGKIGVIHNISSDRETWTLAKDVDWLFPPTMPPKPVNECSAQMQAEPVPEQVVALLPQLKRSRASLLAFTAAFLIALLIGLLALLAFRERGEQQPVNRVATIVQASLPAVAHVEAPAWNGSGFMIGPQILATNFHVAGPLLASEITVEFPSDVQRHAYKIKRVLWGSQQRDLCILQLDGTRDKYLKLANESGFQPGEQVVVIGNPGALLGTIENAVSVGVMSSRKDLYGEPWYQMTVVINHGNSGGPAIDMKSEVVGVATLGATEADQLNFFIPSTAISENAAKFLRNPSENDISIGADSCAASVAVHREIGWFLVYSQIIEARGQYSADHDSFDQRIARIPHDHPISFDSIIDMYELRHENQMSLKPVDDVVRMIKQSPNFSQGFKDRMDEMANLLTKAELAAQPKRTDTEYRQSAIELDKEFIQLENALKTDVNWIDFTGEFMKFEVFMSALQKRGD